MMNGLHAYAVGIIEIFKPGGYGYVYGAQGEIITETVLEDLRRKYGSAAPGGPSYYDQERTRKWIGGPAADCSGLIMKLLDLLGAYDRDKTANDLMNECTTVNEQGRHPGDLGFKLRGGRAVHVGIYIGDETVVHARGTDYGVVQTTDAEYGWHRFGRPTFRVPGTEWPEPYFTYLLEQGIVYSDRWFSSTMNRGEYFAARAKEIQATKQIIK